MAVERALQAAFLPINAVPVTGAAGTVSTTPILLFANLTTQKAKRRIRVANTHASQTLALHFVAYGTAGGGAQSVTSDGAVIIFPRTAESFLVDSSLTILIVGEGASTTFQAITSDI